MDEDEGKTYHEVFNELSSKYGYIALGIYRRVEKEPVRDLKSRRASSISIFKRGRKDDLY